MLFGTWRTSMEAVVHLKQAVCTYVTASSGREPSGELTLEGRADAKFGSESLSRVTVMDSSSLSFGGAIAIIDGINQPDLLRLSSENYWCFALARRTAFATSITSVRPSRHEGLQ